MKLFLTPSTKEHCLAVSSSLFRIFTVYRVQNLFFRYLEENEDYHRRFRQYTQI